MSTMKAALIEAQNSEFKIADIARPTAQAGQIQNVHGFGPRREALWAQADGATPAAVQLELPKAA